MVAGGIYNPLKPDHPTIAFYWRSPDTKNKRKRNKVLCDWQPIKKGIALSNWVISPNGSSDYSIYMFNDMERWVDNNLNVTGLVNIKQGSVLNTTLTIKGAFNSILYFVRARSSNGFIISSPMLEASKFW